MKNSFSHSAPYYPWCSRVFRGPSIGGPIMQRGAGFSDDQKQYVPVWCLAFWNNPRRKRHFFPTQKKDISTTHHCNPSKNWISLSFSKHQRKCINLLELQWLAQLHFSTCFCNFWYPISACTRNVFWLKKYAP